MAELAPLHNGAPQARPPQHPPEGNATAVPVTRPVKTGARPEAAPGAGQSEVQSGAPTPAASAGAQSGDATLSERKSARQVEARDVAPAPEQDSRQLDSLLVNLLHRRRPSATRVDQVHEAVNGYPHTNRRYGQILYDFVREHRLTRILELGTNHGVSTCYAGAAVASLGGGHVVTIDRLSAAAYQPGVLSFRERLGLDEIIIPIFERDTYNWRLRAFLAQVPRPEFDLVFIDGAHTWEPDALAFLLTEMMLRPGGWFIFDDINWCIGESPTAGVQAGNVSLTVEQQCSRQVREIVELLVWPHPNIASWHEDAKWGYARKKTRAEMNLDLRQAALFREFSIGSLAHARDNFPYPIEVPPDLDQPRWRRAVDEGMRRNRNARGERAAEAKQEAITDG